MQVDYFLKNAQKRAILSHLQNFTESNKSLSGHVPPLPKPQTKIFLNHCDAIRTSKEENFCSPPCRETTCPSTDRVMCGWDPYGSKNVTCPMPHFLFQYLDSLKLSAQTVQNCQTPEYHKMDLAWSKWGLTPLWLNKYYTPHFIFQYVNSLKISV